MAGSSVVLTIASSYSFFALIRQNEVCILEKMLVSRSLLEVYLYEGQIKEVCIEAHVS